MKRWVDELKENGPKDIGIFIFIQSLPLLETRSTDMMKKKFSTKSPNNTQPKSEPFSKLSVPNKAKTSLIFLPQSLNKSSKNKSKQNPKSKLKVLKKENKRRKDVADFYHIYSFIFFTSLFKSLSKTISNWNKKLKIINHWIRSVKFPIFSNISEIVCLISAFSERIHFAIEELK